MLLRNVLGAYVDDNRQCGKDGEIACAHYFCVLVLGEQAQHIASESLVAVESTANQRGVSSKCVVTRRKQDREILRATVRSYFSRHGTERFMFFEGRRWSLNCSEQSPQS
jgi:hypothetical protein